MIIYGKLPKHLKQIIEDINTEKTANKYNL